MNLTKTETIQREKDAPKIWKKLKKQIMAEVSHIIDESAQYILEEDYIKTEARAATVEVDFMDIYTKYNSREKK